MSRMNKTLQLSSVSQVLNKRTRINHAKKYYLYTAPKKNGTFILDIVCLAIAAVMNREIGECKWKRNAMCHVVPIIWGSCRSGASVHISQTLSHRLV